QNQRTRRSINSPSRGARIGMAHSTIRICKIVSVQSPAAVPPPIRHAAMKIDPSRYLRSSVLSFGKSCSLYPDRCEPNEDSVTVLPAFGDDVSFKLDALVSALLDIEGCLNTLWLVRAFGDIDSQQVPARVLAEDAPIEPTGGP